MESGLYCLSMKAPINRGAVHFTPAGFFLQRMAPEGLCEQKHGLNILPRVSTPKPFSVLKQGSAASLTALPLGQCIGLLHQKACCKGRLIS